ncbi:DegT/DnrJ/EryC1/StrS family aminotransferase, partial [Nitrospinae bacterium AH-259-F20]|nr:DegT/DnrJ/EryC1/StrS family aminotransferase [Nitrospinae bacterium AH-259-F20]
PLLGRKEAEYVAECIRTGWISSAGRFVDEFERAWADYCGMKHGVAVSSGTAALQVAVGCLDLEPGDEVIMPTFTIISCAMAVVEMGGVPVLVDSDERTWCMDVGQVEDKITPRTRAIMVVHMYGHPVDMDPMLDLADKHGLAIIEDAAQVHGAEYTGRKCGGLGEISTFSFYSNKIITTGEGGMLLTNDDIHAEKARCLRNLCFIQERRFFHKRLGYNFRLTNMQAAVGLAQVQRVEELVARKRSIGAAYTERLCDIKVLQLPVEEPWAKNVYWMYGLVLDESTGLDAVAFAERLAERGVMTRPFFLGMHEQPVFHDMGLFKGEVYPIAERLARQGLYLPSGLPLTEEQIDTVCQAVRDSLAAWRVARPGR